MLTAALLVCLTAASAWADDVKTVQGSFTYYGNEDVSRAECKRRALEGARQAALAKEFGTIVSQGITSGATVSNSDTNEYYAFMSSTEVKGEWIADEGEPKYDISLDNDGNLVVACTVRGKARAISNEAMDFASEVLKNAATRQAADTQFKQGDHMYLYFRAPADGYLAVYLLDDNQKAWSLLPYSGDPSSIVKIKKNQEYYFFDPEHGDGSCDVDVLKMTSRQSMERNEVYVLFSPNAFNKALDEQVDENLPRQLSLDDFSKWVSKIRHHDKKMNLKRIPILITNPDYNNY